MCSLKRFAIDTQAIINFIGGAIGLLALGGLVMTQMPKAWQTTDGWRLEPGRHGMPPLGTVRPLDGTLRAPRDLDQACPAWAYDERETGDHFRPREQLGSIHSAKLDEERMTALCRSNGERSASIRAGFAKACEKAGISDFLIHDLRHTCAAHLISAGCRSPR
ncbi:site-specific integrase [Stutzerimonas azotifigens]|uniref:tyrosine-type recombinase/integrase n=1 Tax=Stutzerimonas azotifigens TaxID=291995 RepID=UPI0004892928|nr:tyrosine-type recombinase/integrase [Stutzerimonas azotifigens]